MDNSTGQSPPAVVSAKSLALERLKQMRVNGIVLHPEDIVLLRLHKQPSIDPDPLNHTWKLVWLDDDRFRHTTLIDHETAIKLIIDLTRAGFGRSYFSNTRNLFFWSIVS